ncbi:DUF5682 family protein, partial [Streptomyces sp. NPDC059447]|uniref:DUF5682 family protein n=1 Tax=Streptomyces sp. NPDC059447 TaxID=3346834 RepID=UPI0036A9ADFC
MTPDPKAALDALAASRTPYLLGVRHHSPALATVVPALLDASGADVVCVELPADFQPWLPHLADRETLPPIALAGTSGDGRLAFYPFADFSPELAAIRWAAATGATVLCCDLPLGAEAWTPRATPRTPSTNADRPEDPAPTSASSSAPASGRAPASGTDPAPGSGVALVPAQGSGSGRGGSFADGLAAAGTGRDGEDMWDRAVEVLAPGCAPEAVRRAALGVGWALRADTGAVEPRDLAREAHMREVIEGALAEGHRVAAVIGAFHAPALLPTAPAPQPGAADGRPNSSADVPAAGVSGPGRAAAPTAAGAGAGGSAGSGAEPRAGRDSGTDPALGLPPVPGTGTVAGGHAASGAPRAAGQSAPAPAPAPAVTSLVAYSFDLLDSRSGYPAGIRDPLWQQAVLEAGGDPALVREAASGAVVRLCRELRRAGHTAGTGEAAETLRLACDLAVLRGLPAPGRGELLEAVTTVLGQGEPLGRGRALARALEAVLVGTARGRITPHAPRSGLGPAVEAELAELRLPGPDDPASKELRLDPLRSALDARREVLLQRLLVCGASYGEPAPVAATGDGTALGTKWRLSWTPSVPARL